MYDKFYLYIALAITILFASACTASLPGVGRGTAIMTASTPTPTPDPWTQAVDEAQQALEGAELNAHFQFYQESADKIDDYLGQLEKLRPALRFIDTLKSTNLPIVGNVWDGLIAALNKAHLGSGTALEQVDASLRDLLDSHRRLQRLDELDGARAAVQRFQEAPSRETLKAMGEEMARADFILAGVDKDAARLQNQVDALLEAIGQVQKGLHLASGLSPQVQDALQKIQQFIANIASPVQKLAKTLEAMRQQIAEDRDLFWQIQDIIEKANNPR